MMMMMMMMMILIIFLLITMRSSVSALQRAVSVAKQRWSVIGWVTKNLLSRTPPSF
jgi:hypothetical protein